MTLELPDIVAPSEATCMIRLTLHKPSQEILNWYVDDIPVGATSVTFQTLFSVFDQYLVNVTDMKRMLMVMFGLLTILGLVNMM